MAPSIQIKIGFLENLTTRASIRAGKRFFDGKVDKTYAGSGELAFVQAADDGFTLDTPPRTCSVGHQLELEMEVVVPGRRTLRFRTAATVIAAESFAGAHERISIRFHPLHDHTVWAMVLAALEERQAHVAGLFSSMKGA